MNSIQVRVPKAIEQLMDGEQDRLLRSALRIAAKTRVKELTQERREAVTHIRRLERKYNATWTQFEKQLPRTNAIDVHKDYNTWFFWTGVLERANKAQSALKKLAAAE